MTTSLFFGLDVSPRSVSILTVFGFTCGKDSNDQVNKSSQKSNHILGN